jgi:large repetitive protein
MNYSMTKNITREYPAPASADYAEGLLEGNHCIQLTIEDGGKNDADGVVNGIVVDTGVLAVEAEVVKESVAKKGGSLGFCSMILLGLGLTRRTKK